MKNKIYIGIITILLLSSVALAHPPDSLIMSFDSTSTVLTVRIFHTVKNTTNHLINDVAVNLNGKPMITQKFSSQLNKDEQVVIYKIIDAKANDKIAVTAKCNVMGKKTAELTYRVAR